MSDPTRGTWPEVFRAFLQLGCTAFGGPIAHLGYLRAEFVERRAWLSEAQFAQLLAISQLLPGPASSQLGFSIGLLRAGWRGGLAAFVAFTLPSVLVLLLFAQLASALDSPLGAAVVHGLGLVAVAVVAHGVWRMARLLTPDVRRLVIAAAAAAVMLYTGSAAWQLAVIAAGALLGALLCEGSRLDQSVPLPGPFGHSVAVRLLALFVALLVSSLAWSLAVPSALPSLGGLAAELYRAGALVFGGGHVVLPLLETTLVDSGWMTAETFFSGYGAAQAVPGPLFSVAAFFGASVPTGAPALLGAAVATFAIFLPGFLLMAAMLPLWGGLARVEAAPRMLAGINAAVVGLLAAALYDPVWTTAIASRADVLIAALAIAFLLVSRRSTLWVVAWCVGASVATRLATRLMGG